MSGGGSTISTSEPMLGALRVQQSSYGLALPIVYGRTRVPGNLIWYGDFKAIPHTTTTSSGGKGGGDVTQQNTTYTYEAAVMMALCEGPVAGIVSIWRSKERFEQKHIEAQYVDQENPAYQPDPELSNYDPRRTISVFVPAHDVSAVEQLGLSFSAGNAGQPIWGHLSTNHAAQAIGYSSTAMVYGASYQLSSNAEIYNHSFELDGKLQYGGGVVDANPRDVVIDMLTNPQYGANFPASHIADLGTFSDYCRAMGLFISPAFSEQQEAQAHLRDIVRLTHSEFVWSEGLLKIVPYGDEQVTGNGATYTPNLTPLYDLTDDDFHVDGSEDPVKSERKTPADAFNQVQIEFLNRSNAYNLEIAEAKDQANIELYGLRPQEPIKMHGICDGAIAQRVAQLLLQRALYVRNEYSFRLGWKFVLLEPMDLVTLTDPGLGLSKTPVRITSIEEDEDGLLSLRAEDYPFGVASAALYPSQAGLGYAANYSADPGNVSVPTFFEPPIDLAAATGLEVWCAVSGQSPMWGGARVWASLDGASYKKVGEVRGGARYGTLTAPLAAESTAGLSIALAGLGGQLLSGTALEATLLKTLCWVEGAGGGELMAHAGATLVGANAYSLAGLVRGAYRSQVSAHASGAKFVRIDDAIVKSDPLDESMIGKTIHFKFTSFNVYGGGEQSLSDVAAYDYTITGDMFKLPPSGVAGLGMEVLSTGVKVSWSMCQDADYGSTIVKVGATWETATEVANRKADNCTLNWQSAGVLKVWAAHIDTRGNVGAPVSAAITIAKPAAPTGLAITVGNTGLRAAWAMPALASTAQPVDRVELSWSSDFAAIVDAKKATSATFDWRGAGAHVLYARTVDVAGNVGDASQVAITIAKPAAPAGLAITVGNTGLRAAWALPALASTAQPVDRVELSWSSDFAAIVDAKKATSATFDWRGAGAHVLYARTVDVAGNVGDAVNASITVAMPGAVMGLALSAGNTGLQATWAMPALAALAQPVDRVELSWSSNFASVIDAKRATAASFGWRAPGLVELFVRVVDVFGNTGTVASASLTVRAPSAPTGLAVAIGNTGARATWSAPAVAADQQPLGGVQLSWLADFSQLIEARAATSVDLGWLPAGSRTLYARYMDAAGNTGAAASTAFSVASPSAPASMTLAFGTANIEAKWTAPNVGASQQALERVELSWSGAFTTVIDAKKATTATFGWMPAGDYTLFARYIDMAGNIGAVSTASLQVLVPAQPTMTAVETQVNAVTLRWQDAKTSQPIRKYSIWYGDAGTAYASATLYGAAGADSRSDILFYRSSGQKVAYLVAEDVAGNLSTPRQIDVRITMPDNFVLASEYFEDWQSSELVNGTILNGSAGQIMLPAYDGRTWGQRLSDNGWTTAQQKVDAGFPIVAQPVPSSGKHVEQHDLGKVITTGVVRVTPTIVSSAPGYTATIRIRASNGDTSSSWQSWLVGDSASFTNFRFIEVEYGVTSDGKGFVVLDDLAVKVEISEVTESAALTLNATDANGTPYTCTKPFIDVRTAQATPLGSANIARLNCIVDDATTPARIYVQAWDTNNNRTGGTVSLNINGVSA